MMSPWGECPSLNSAEVCGCVQLSLRGGGQAGSPHCCLCAASFLPESLQRQLLCMPGEVMLGSLGPSLQIRLVALPEMTSFVRQISSLGSFLISDMSNTETIPIPQALRKLSCIASLCSRLCLFIIHGIMFVL